MGLGEDFSESFFFHRVWNQIFWVEYGFVRCCLRKLMMFVLFQRIQLTFEQLVWMKMGQLEQMLSGMGYPVRIWWLVLVGMVKVGYDEGFHCCCCYCCYCYMNCGCSVVKEEKCCCFLVISCYCCLTPLLEREGRRNYERVPFVSLVWFGKKCICRTLCWDLKLIHLTTRFIRSELI